MKLLRFAVSRCGTGTGSTLPSRHHGPWRELGSRLASQWSPRRPAEPIPTSLTSSPTDLWEKISLRLIHQPVGSLDSFHLNETEQAIQFWNARNNEESSREDEEEIATSSISFRLLDRLAEEVQDDPSIATVLSYDNISLTVNRWRLLLRQGDSNSNNNGNEHRLSPEEVLQKVERYSAVSSGSFQPSVEIYNMILDGMSRYNDDRGTNYRQEFPDKVHSFLEHMMEQGCAPTIITYASAIHAIATSDHPQAPQQALELLQVMKEQARLTHKIPTSSAYGSILGCLARSVKTKATVEERVAMALQAETLLSEMEEEWGLPRNHLACSLVLHTWAQTLSPQAGERAQAILDRMVQEFDMQNNGLVEEKISWQKREETNHCKPDKYCFSAVMNAWARNGNVKKVEELLHRLQNLYEVSHGDPDFFPNAFCFNALIEAWSNVPLSNTNNGGTNETSDVSIGQQAESILARMIGFSEWTSNDDCLPNLISYQLVLFAYSNEPNPKHHKPAAERALAILQHMKSIEMTADTVGYNSALECIVKCTHDPQWARTAEWLVQEEMPQPDVVSYRQLIRAFAGDAEKAERILMDMCQSSSSRNIQPDTSCFNTVITAWSRSKSLDAGPRGEALLRKMRLDYNIEPDVISFNSAMNCWANMASHRPEAADRAFSILRYMQQEAANSKSGMKPNIVSFTTVMWAFAAAKEPEKAERLFFELEKASMENSLLKPTLICYNAVISAWAKVGQPMRAQAVLDALVTRSSLKSIDGDHSLLPNTAVYSTLLSAWAMAGDVEKSVSLLQQMCDDYSSGKNKHAAPNERCFSSVIVALSRSNDPDAAPQAEACLTKMQDMADSGLPQVRPNVYTFQNVISAWAKSDLPIAAEQAERNLQRLKDLYYKEGDFNCRPNVVAYTNTLRAWSRASCLDSGSDGGRTLAKHAVERSEALLTEMLESELPDIRPNQITYGTILRTIAESRLADKSARAERIAQIMQENGIALDSFARKQLRKASQS